MHPARPDGSARRRCTALLCLAAAAWAVASFGSAGEVTILPAYAFSGKAVRDCWTPVTVDIRYTPANPSDTLDAELRLHTWREPDAPVPFVYRRPFTMGAGRKVLTVLAMNSGPLSPDGTDAWAVSVVDRRDQRELARTELPRSHPDLNRDSRLDPETILLVTLAEPSGSRTEGGWITASIWAADAWRSELLTPSLFGRITQPNTCVSAALLPADAPDRWAGYHSVHTLVWHQPDPSALRPAQIDAIRNWVWQGGRLLLTLDSDRPIPDLTPIIDLLPAAITGRGGVELRPMQNLGASEQARHRLPAWLESPMAGQWVYSASPDASQDPWTVPAPEGDALLPLLTLEPASESRVILGGDAARNAPILALRRPVGRGFVTLLAVDLNAWPLAAHPGRHALGGRALGIAFDPRDRLRIEPQNALSEDFLRSGPDLVDMARAYLSYRPELQPAPFHWIVIFLAAYVILIGPVDYFLLHRWRSLHRTWLTLSVYVIAFSLLAYAGAYAVRGGRTLARSIVIRDETADGGHTLTRTCFGLYAAQNSRFDIAFGTEGLPVTIGESTHASGNRAAASSPMSDVGAFWQGTPHEMRDAAVRQWSVKFFDALELQPQPTPIVRGDLHYDGLQLRGSFEVTADAPLQEALVIGRHGLIELGRLPPGTVWQARSAPAPAPLAEALARLVAQRSRSIPRSTGMPWSSLATGAPPPSPEPWSPETLALLSLNRLANARLRPVIQEEQFVRPGDFRQIPRRTPTPSAPPAQRLQRGLSIEQIWNARAPGDRQGAGDLSGVIREGGLVLFARIDRPGDEVRVRGWTLEREGFTMVRIVFPPSPAAQAGRLWNDDLYGRPDPSLRRSAGTRGP